MQVSHALEGGKLLSGAAGRREGGTAGDPDRIKHPRHRRTWISVDSGKTFDSFAGSGELGELSGYNPCLEYRYDSKIILTRRCPSLLATEYTLFAKSFVPSN